LVDFAGALMARERYQVVVLECQTAYRERFAAKLCCVGVAELLRLDLEMPLLEAGGMLQSPPGYVNSEPVGGP
jgi:hypothetical protein